MSFALVKAKGLGARALGNKEKWPRIGCHYADETLGDARHEENFAY